MQSHEFASSRCDWAVDRGIRDSQIEAAVTLRHEHLQGWRRSAEVLYAMGRELGSDSLPLVLGKVAAVDSLYNAQVGRVLLMAEWILELEQERRLSGPSRVSAVEMIASMKGASDGGCQVFASKYAHFCVDPAGFAIFDKYAARAALRHWGRNESLIEGRDRYARFCHILDRVRAESEEGVRHRSYGDLDAYLWLTGVYREWLRDPAGARILTECRVLFEQHAGKTTPAGTCLAQMVPDTKWLMETIQTV